MARVRARKVAGQLVLREYLPLGAWLLAWALIGLAVGHADAVRLLAASFFVQALRAVATLETFAALTRWAYADKPLFKASRRRAVRYDLAGLFLALLLTAALALFLEWRGMAEAAVMVMIAALSLPARHPLALFAVRRNRVVPWRMGSAVLIVAGAALVLLLDLGWIGAAAVLALRDWAGLVAAVLFGGPRPRPQSLPDRPLDLAAAAGQTEANARRKLSYRLIKTVSSVLLGPFGNVAARTGRSAGKLDSRLARIVPRHRGGYVLFTLGTATAAAVLLMTSREPAALLASAGSARLAASGAAVLMWWRYAGEVSEDEDDD